MEIINHGPPNTFTQSQLNMQDRCDLEYVFRYLYWLIPRGFSIPMFRGSLIHHVFEVILDEAKHKNKVEVCDLPIIIRDYCDTTLKDNEEALTHAEGIRHAAVQVRSIVVAWITLFHKELLDEYSIVDTEQEITIPVHVDNTTTVSFSGKLDALLRRKSDDKLVLGEHKSKSSLFFACESAVNMDTQVVAYLMLLSEKYGEDIYEVLYNTYAMPMHKFGRNASTDDQLCQNMLKAIMADYDKYFLFNPVTIDDRTFYVIKYQILDKVCKLKALADEHGDIPIHMGHTSCVRFNKPCPYMPICSTLRKIPTLGNLGEAISNYPLLGNYKIDAPNQELTESE